MCRTQGEDVQSWLRSHKVHLHIKKRQEQDCKVSAGGGAGGRCAGLHWVPSSGSGSKTAKVGLTVLRWVGTSPLCRLQGSPVASQTSWWASPPPCARWSRSRSWIASSTAQAKPCPTERTALPLNGMQAPVLSWQAVPTA